MKINNNLNCYSPVMQYAIYLWLLSRFFYWSLVFRILTSLCLAPVFLISILFRIDWASCICNFCLSPILVKFQPFFSIIFFMSHSFSFPSKILTSWVLNLLLLSHRSFSLSYVLHQSIFFYLQIRSLILI